MKTVFIVTEANADVATGHLMECIVCAEELVKNGYEVLFWINDDMESELKRRITFRVLEYHKSIENDYEVLVEEVCQICPRVLLFNLREISGEFLELCKTKISDKTTVICIDEFGHRNLQADIIVNPMIDPYYWDYGESRAQLFCGAKYLFLDGEVNRLHRMEKKIRKNIESILITMGGVDPKNYTLFLATEIPLYFPDAEIDIVLGGGNRNREDVYRKVQDNAKISVYENISNMPKMIYRADLIICAGGNTLHEAACIGTPAIIFPSMPHEIRTAKCFADKGFGYVIDVENILQGELWEAYERMMDYSTRKRMSNKGKELSDGLGLEYVMDIIRKI